MHKEQIVSNQVLHSDLLIILCTSEAAKQRILFSHVRP